MKRTQEQIINIICGMLHISNIEYKQHSKNGERWCGGCKSWQKETEFYKWKSGKYCGFCRNCERDRVRDYGRRNKKDIAERKHNNRISDINARIKSRERNKRFHKNNPNKQASYNLRRRVAHNSIDFDYDKLKKLRHHYVPKNNCMCCGEVSKLEIEHIIPVALGGKTMLENLQFLCKRCNLKKHTKTIDYRPDGGKFARQLKNSR